MNFSIYVSKELAAKMTKFAKMSHRSRNSIITEALEEWLNMHTPSQWPKNFFDFEPLGKTANFDQFREDFKNISEDPLA